MVSAQLGVSVYFLYQPLPNDRGPELRGKCACTYKLQENSGVFAKLDTREDACAQGGRVCESTRPWSGAGEGASACLIRRCSHEVTPQPMLRGERLWGACDFLRRWVHAHQTCALRQAYGPHLGGPHLGGPHFGGPVGPIWVGPILIGPVGPILIGPVGPMPLQSHRGCERA